MNKPNGGKALAPKIALVVAQGALAATAGAAEIATDPGDYAALPPGARLGIVYYQHTERNAFHSGGDRVPGPFKLKTDIGLLRYVHFTKLGDYVIDPQIIVPFGSVSLKEPMSQSASGVGDPMLGGTLWLVNQPEKKQWFGLSAFASLPLGQYEAAKGGVNVGQNRWKGIFQAGYVTALGSSFMLDAILETAVYGRNDNYAGQTLKQDESFSAQAHLRYMVSPTSHWALSYFHDFGGETRLDGVAQRDRMNNNRLLASFATFVTPDIQLQVQGGQAVHTENGWKESSRLNLRLVKVF